jgi:hypothetical protein
MERYEPGWAAAPSRSHSQLGPVGITFAPSEIGSGWFRATVTYTLGNRSWSQEFTAANITDDTLSREAEVGGLAVSGWLNDTRTWVCLRPV